MNIRISYEKFERDFRLIYQPEKLNSKVLVVNRANERILKTYHLDHEGRLIEMMSDEYYNMPDWMFEKLKPLLASDFNVQFEES